MVVTDEYGYSDQSTLVVQVTAENNVAPTAEQARLSHPFCGRSGHLREHLADRISTGILAAAQEMGIKRLRAAQTESGLLCLYPGGVPH